ncbi:MAG: response regulator [Deltaproteobacteria bacterium]|jgi:DNA-binding NtrC family response regulator|nr:response regulator [Deltaproteobacteria bacterium]
MSTETILKDKAILVVDDEPDILDSIAEQLDMCRIYRAKDYEIALQLLAALKFDIVILDVMGVRGFELLKKSVSKGFPTVMLTAHAMTPEALKESIQLGAVSFLPKEMMAELDTYLTDVVTGSKKVVWKNLLDKLGDYFERQFGADWKEKDDFFKKFEEELSDSKKESP